MHDEPTTFRDNLLEAAQLLSVMVLQGFDLTEARRKALAEALARGWAPMIAIEFISAADSRMH